MKSKNNYVIIIFLSFVTLVACNNYLEKEEISELLEFTNSKDIEVYDEGKDLVIDISESNLKDFEVCQLYSSSVAVTVFNITNKSKKILFHDGTCIVNFLSSDSIKHTFRFPYTELFKIVDIYKTDQELLQFICNKDRKLVEQKIDNSVVSSKDKELIVDALINSDLCINNTDYINYGYYIDNENSLNTNMISLYVNFTYPNGDVKNVIFNYLEKSKKLVGVEEIT